MSDPRMSNKRERAGGGTRSESDSPASTAAQPDKAPLLETVASASAAFEAAREGLREAVHAALDQGASWAEIGATLGVSRQAAFDRFGPKHAVRPDRFALDDGAGPASDG